MKKLLCLLTCFILSGSAFAQNAFSVISKTPRLASNAVKPIVISRTTTVPLSQAAFAKKVCTGPACKGIIVRSHKKTLYAGNIQIPQYYIESQFAIARLNRPENLHGGYNYLRMLFKFSRKPRAIEPHYIENWQEIFNSQTYNGAHHIVNKSSLREIYTDMKLKAAEKGLPFPINLTEMQNNAPAIFHRLHGNPDFKHIFHNADRQVGLYYTGGIKMVIEDFFDQIRHVSLQLNAPELQVPQAVQKATMTEAELWCKMFHLRWQ